MFLANKNIATVYELDRANERRSTVSSSRNDCLNSIRSEEKERRSSGHRSKVQKLDVTVSAREVSLKASGREDLSLEIWTALRKASMFERTLKRPVRIVTT